MRSRMFTFGGANIKGTPAMPARFVRSDIKIITNLVDVLVVQEFRHRWYWATVRTLLGTAWGSYPGFVTGLAQPTYGGQAIFWRRRFFKKSDSRVMEAFDFGLDNSGIMENRWIRAALLQCRKTLLSCWFVSMHAVVHGDAESDPARRKLFMKQNLNRLDQTLSVLTRTDAPVVFEADMNIHQGTWAYVELMSIVHKYRGRVIGTHGVEFLIVFDHHCKTDVVVDKQFVLVPKSQGLHTDHEVRCMDFYLQS